MSAALRHVLLAVLVVGLLGPAIARAQGMPEACLEGVAEEGDYLDLGRPEDRFSRCLRAYDSGALGQAVGCLDSLVREGSDGAHVLYNLGNSYFRLGRYDCAVLALRSAAVRAPRDPDVAENLATARSRLTDHTEPAALGPLRTALLFWYDRASSRELWWVAALLLLSASVLRLRRDSGWGPPTVLLIVGGVLGAAAVAKDASLLEAPGAVVVVSEVAGRSDRDSGSVELFRLHAGAEVSVYSRDEIWVQVGLPGGTRAWLPRESLGLVE